MRLLITESTRMRLDDVSKRARQLAADCDAWAHESEEIGVRDDRREDLECICNRDVTEAELDEFIDLGQIPADGSVAA